MSASERLAALRRQIEPGFNAHDEDVVLAALPEIVAVVRAAEHVDDEHGEGLPAAIGTAESLHEALAALDAKLAEK